MPGARAGRQSGPRCTWPLSFGTRWPRRGMTTRLPAGGPPPIHGGLKGGWRCKWSATLPCLHRLRTLVMASCEMMEGLRGDSSMRTCSTQGRRTGTAWIRHRWVVPEQRGRFTSALCTWVSHSLLSRTRTVAHVHVRVRAGPSHNDRADGDGPATYTALQWLTHMQSGCCLPALQLQSVELQGPHRQGPARPAVHHVPC